MNDQEHLRRAVELGRKGMITGVGGPFGALVVRDGQIISEGQNQVTSQLDPTAHAEVVAIRRACQALGVYSLQGCVIYASCEPCPMCLAAIYWSRCERLVFAANRQDAAEIGFDDAVLYRELALPIADRTLNTTQDLRGEALTMMSDWSKLADRRHY